MRATDELDLSTSSTNQGRLTINVQIAGDNPPNTTITPGGTQPPLQVLQLNLAGTATDDFGVAAVEVSVRDRDSSRYLQDNGTLAAAFNTRTAVLSPPTGLSVNWTLAVDLPAQGDYDVTAIAYDTVGQQDTSRPVRRRGTRPTRATCLRSRPRTCSRPAERVDVQRSQDHHQRPFRGRPADGRRSRWRSSTRSAST